MMLSALYVQGIKIFMLGDLVCQSDFIVCLINQKGFSCLLHIALNNIINIFIINSTISLRNCRSIFCANEMSASENQAVEARMDTSVRKIGPTGNKIRIRLPLPLRKRLAEGLQTMSTGLPEDTKKHAAKEVPEYTNDTTENTTFIDTELKIEKVSTKPPSIKLSMET